MITLLDLKPKKSSFIVKVGGKRLHLWLRAFTLRDSAWLQENFTDVELQQKLMNHDFNLITQLIWHQLESESKKKILDLPVKFVDVDDFGNEFEVELKGHEILLELFDQRSILKGLEAFTKSRGINSAKVAEELKGLKKKTPNPIMTGLKFLIS